MTQPPRLTLVISGGQTGADQGGLLGARDAGVRTGGTAPKGWRTENGPALWLAEFGLVENRTASYPTRTRANVEGADGTVIFGDPLSSGSVLTERCCRKLGKPVLHIPFGREVIGTDAAARRLAEWVLQNGIETLNVAGNRESGNRGIGEFTRKVVHGALLLLQQRADR